MQGKKILVYFPNLSIFNGDLQRKPTDPYREYDFTKNRKGREVSGINQVKVLLSSVNSMVVGKNKQTKQIKVVKAHFLPLKYILKELRILLKYNQWWTASKELLMLCNVSFRNTTDNKKLCYHIDLLQK